MCVYVFFLIVTVGSTLSKKFTHHDPHYSLGKMAVRKRQVQSTRACSLWTNPSSTLSLSPSCGAAVYTTDVSLADGNSMKYRNRVRIHVWFSWFASNAIVEQTIKKSSIKMLFSVESFTHSSEMPKWPLAVS